MRLNFIGFFGIPSLLFISLTAFSAQIPAEISGKDVLTGQQIRVNTQSAGKHLVISFLSAKCHCSASHEEILNDLATQYKNSGFLFYGIHSNSDESQEMTEKHFKDSQMLFPILQDQGALLADQFGALKTPHVYVIAPNGKIIYQGGVDDTHDAADATKHYLKNALAEIKAGKLPSLSQTRSLGCVIRRP